MTTFTAEASSAVRNRPQWPMRTNPAAAHPAEAPRVFSEYSVPKERPRPESDRVANLTAAGSVPPMANVGGSTSANATAIRSGSGPPPGSPMRPRSSGSFSSMSVTEIAEMPVAISSAA